MAQIHLTHILRIAAALSKLCHGRIRELSRHRAHPSPSRTPAHPKSLKTASAPVRELIAAARLRAMGGRASAEVCADWPNGRRPLSAVAHWCLCAATNSRRRLSGIPSRCSRSAPNAQPLTPPCTPPRPHSHTHTARPHPPARSPRPVSRRQDERLDEGKFVYPATLPDARANVDTGERVGSSTRSSASPTVAPSGAGAAGSSGARSSPLQQPSQALRGELDSAGDEAGSGCALLPICRHCQLTPLCPPALALFPAPPPPSPPSFLKPP